MKKNMIIAAAVLASAVACTKEIEEPSALDGKVQMSFAVSTEQTKTVLEGTKSTLWTGVEKLSIFDGESNNLFAAELSAPAATAQFSGKAAAAPTYYALYPYNSAAKLSGTTVSTKLPAVQTATKGTFDPSAALLFGTADGTLVSLKNLTAMLKLTVPANVTSIEVDGNGTALAGSVNINVESSELSGATASKVTLSGKGALEAGTYYIAVAPATVSGLSVKLIDSANSKYILRSVADARTLAANTIYDMGEFKASEWVAGSETPGLVNKDANNWVLYSNGFYEGVSSQTMTEVEEGDAKLLKWEFASDAAWANYGVLDFDPYLDLKDADVEKACLKFRFKVEKDGGPVTQHTLFRIYFGASDGKNAKDVWLGAVGRGEASLEYYNIVVNDNEWHELSLPLKDYIADLSGVGAARQLGFTPKDAPAAVGTTVLFNDIRLENCAVAYPTPGEPSVDPTPDTPKEFTDLIYDDAISGSWVLDGTPGKFSETTDEHSTGTKSVKWYCESAWFNSACVFRLPTGENKDISSYSKLKFDVKITATGNASEHPFEPGDETFTIRIYGGTAGTDTYSEAYYVYRSRTTDEGGEGDWHTVEVPIKTSTDADAKWDCFVLQGGSNAYPFKHFYQFCFHNMEWSENAGNIYIDNVTLVK